MEDTYQDKIRNTITNDSKILHFDFTDGSEELTEIPSEIFEFKHLEELHLGGMQISEISSEILKLINIKEITIKSDSIKKFPLILLELPKLEKLSLQSINLVEIPKKLNNWFTLKYLNLSGCNSLKKFLGIPPSLHYLNILNTSITNITPVIRNLELTKIVMGNENSIDFPKEILEMKSLLALFIENMVITPFLEDFSKLENLHELWVSKCSLEDFPMSFCKLKKLKKINISGNRIRTLPNELVALELLEDLNVGSNRFLDIPDVIFHLKNLVELNFGNYNVKDYSNSIKVIPKEILSLKKLRKLDWFENPVDNIPQTFLQKGIDGIKAYLLSKKEADSEVFLYEAKMVMVGRGHVGKTALTNKLTIPGYQLIKQESTLGISVLKNPFLLKMSGLQDSDHFKFNIWDFGGQEKYDATHQLFITNRSVYLFITEAREESNYLDFYYWLNTIQLFSNGSPVIIVLSKMDERRKLLPETVYRDKFKNIIRFVEVSCAEGYEYTIDALKKAISDAISKLPQTKDKLSNRWVDIRNELEELSKGNDFISYDEYLSVCKIHKLNQAKADYLSLYLNDLGVIIHHQHDILLKKTVFLNTDWCVDGLYSVLDNEFIFKNKGKFKNQDLEEIWKEDRFKDKQPELLKLMQQYELCFSLKDNSGYIAPDLLPVDKSENIIWLKENNMHFEIRYDFMPAGILARFIVKSHSFIKDQMYWKFGVVLEYDDTQALIEEDYIHSKISIALRGHNKKGLLSAIRMFIEEVHQDFDKDNRLIFKEMVPCNCSSCIMQSNPHFFDFKVLRRFEKLQKVEIPCELTGNDVKIKSLISDVQVSGYEDELLTENDLQHFILTIISNVLEKEILSKEGFFNFWRDAKCSDPKNEIEFQPYITNTIDRQCKIKGVQVSREVREANGSVDVLFSYTSKEQKILKLCLEIKKAHHIHVETSISTQLPAYMDSVETSVAIYLVIWFKNKNFSQPSQYPSESALLKQLLSKKVKNKNITPYVINCSKKMSPSRIR